jgi:ketopantoate hydroxymethyltransferase
MDMMVSLVAEAAAQMKRSFHGPDAPYLVADMPDGAADAPDDALRNADRMLAVGAQVIKIEIKSKASMRVLEAVSKRNIPVMAHLGYTPQGGERGRVGRSMDEVLDLFAMACRVRDNGACTLVIEKVSQLANELLCRPSSIGLPVYSIFSGRAPYGGQSLNVWDSVFSAPSKTKFFPPTGTYDVSRYPLIYTPDVIKEHMAELMRLTIEGSFPLDPISQLSREENEMLSKIDPWSDAVQAQQATV